jgi:tRNA-dihydrouridine synthase B
MRVGSLTLASPLWLAPLAGYTNLPFRLVLRRQEGLGLATTDLVNARSLLEKREAALRLLETQPGDEPLAVQLFGAVPAEMRAAAQVVEAMGFAAVDINMGCPARKVCRVGGGSALLLQSEKAVQIAREMVAAVKVPVTAKLRLGWDDRTIMAAELARALEDVGVAAVTIHGRTREQGFGGTVNLAAIRAVVQSVATIPVIGNGDITTPEGAKRMLDETGCAGVAIGRGAFYNPWIFAQTLRYLRTGELSVPPGFDERLRIMDSHLELMIQSYGEDLACRQFRKIGPLYTKGIGPAREFKRGVATLSSRGEFRGLLERFRLGFSPC